LPYGQGDYKGHQESVYFHHVADDGRPGCPETQRESARNGTPNCLPARHPWPQFPPNHIKSSQMPCAVSSSNYYNRLSCSNCCKPLWPPVRLAARLLWGCGVGHGGGDGSGQAALRAPPGGRGDEHQLLQRAVDHRGPRPHQGRGGPVPSPLPAQVSCGRSRARWVRLPATTVGTDGASILHLGSNRKGPKCSVFHLFWE